jgi:hypothetical protein
MSLRLFEFAGWQIEADPELNRLHYGVLQPYDCDCDHCTNWRALGERVFRSDLLRFLEELGVDITKPEEVYENGPWDDRHYYSGWFYLSGTVLAGPPLPTGSTPLSCATVLDSIFSFGLVAGIEGPTPPVRPPNPQLTFEFDSRLPWILPTEPSCAHLLTLEEIEALDSPER